MKKTTEITRDHKGFAAFVNKNWPSDEASWFEKLSISGWMAADWPAEFGGTNWTKQTQLGLITAMSERRCPPIPDSVNVIAPLILTFGSTSEKHYFLPRILDAPEEFTFQIRNKFGPGCFLDSDSKSLLLINEAGSSTPLGPKGEATKILATAYSPLWLMYEKLLGLAHLERVRLHWGEEKSKQQTEIEIEASTIKSLFLQNTSKAYRTIGFLTNSRRDKLYATLFDSLGYYALLTTDPKRDSNEPIPFSSERLFLQKLRKQAFRETSIQKTKMYEEYLDNEKT